MTTVPSALRTSSAELVVAVVVAVLGVVEALATSTDVSAIVLSIGLSLALAVAAGLSRVQPGIALVVVWLTGFFQVVTGTQIMAVEVAIGFVAFGAARWGDRVVLWASALSIPAGAALASYYAYDLGLYQLHWLIGDYRGAVYRFGYAYPVFVVVVGFAVLAAPWLAGLALRFRNRAEEQQASRVVAEAERDQAAEIARLRDAQTRLAHDVHDVVGHSLAVILAQAESAEYLPDADTAALKRTMATIATSARTSLDDVRRVLATSTGAPSAAAPQADLDSLVDGVRSSGHEVVSTVVGTPQPLPPELEVVAFRVMQEMLTNALKHGRRDQPVRVERHWEGDLRIEVQNQVGDSEARPAPDETPLDETQPIVAGQGLEGMRRRVEAVGGRLDVRRRSDPPTFTATAWVPLRAAGGQAP